MTRKSSSKSRKASKNKSKKSAFGIVNGKVDERKSNFIAKILSSKSGVSGWWSEGKPIHPTVSRKLIRRVARNSSTVSAILRHGTNDIVRAGYDFVPVEGIQHPNKKQYKKAIAFFEHPNPDDKGNEWLADLVHDYLLYDDAYWEKSGKKDLEIVEDGIKKSWYGGELEAIWHIDTATMKILYTMDTGQMPDPESGKLAFEQSTSQGKVHFDSRKIIRVSKFREGRLYPHSPLLSLLNIIAGQLNLTGYIGNLFKGNVPKHLLNFGDIDGDDYDRLMLSVQEQLENATNPFGVIAINVPEGFQLQRLMETNREGAFLETLNYYKQEICSSFGIPPAKMGMSTPGRIGNPEEMLDTWYDVVESIHRDIENVINHGALPDLGITDWRFKFREVRPKKIRLEAQALRENAVGCSILRQENGISINEMREKCGWMRIEESWADDKQYPSPRIKPGNPGGLGTPHEEASLGIMDLLDDVAELSEMLSDLRNNITQLKSEVEYLKGDTVSKQKKGDK